MFDENDDFNWKWFWKWTGIVALVLIALWLLLSSIFVVPAGKVAVVTRWGAVNRVAWPGVNFKWPIAEGKRIMDTRTQIQQLDVGAASKDLQTVTSTVAVNYHLDAQYAAQMYQEVGTEYKKIVIDPAIQNIYKATTAEFTAEQLITNREGCRVNAEKALAEQLTKYHIIVERLNIVNFDFSPEFNAAIEAKQVAQQQVETAKQQLAKVKVEAESAIAQAQGQADAQAALKNTGALSPEYLQYLALTKWNGVLPSVVSGATPFVDVSKFTNP